MKSTGGATLASGYDVHYIEYSRQATTCYQAGCQSNITIAGGSGISSTTGPNQIFAKKYDKEELDGQWKPYVWTTNNPFNTGQTATNASEWNWDKLWLPAIIPEQMIENYHRREAIFAASAAEYEVLKAEYDAAVGYQEGHHPDLWQWLFFPPAPIYIPRRPSHPSNLAAYTDMYVMP